MPPEDTQPKTQLFINYRHIDCRPLADHLQQVFEQRLEPGSWFLDREEIGYGKSIDATIEAHLRVTRALLVLIGPNWRDVKDADGDRRLMNAGDWVRREIELAREWGKLVVPVIYQHSRFESDTCPWLERKIPSLAFLAGLRAFHLTEENLETEVPRLLTYLQEETGLVLRPAVSEPVQPTALLPKLREELDRSFPILPQYRIPNSPGPFKGLAYFEKEDAALFFGRSAELLKLRRAVHNFSLVLLYGQSGVGKSSLLNAGLIPRLEPDYPVRYLRRDKGRGYHRQLADLLSDFPSGLAILDQVEELFTDPLPKPEDRQEEVRAFFDCLIDERHRTERQFVLGFRSEYFAPVRSLLEERGLLLTPDQELYLQPLAGEGLREAIEGVAQDLALSNKYRFTLDPALPDLLRQDLERGELPAAHTAPLLQYQLQCLWEATEPERADAAERIELKAETYLEIRKAGLEELLDEKLAGIAADWPEALEQGLVLEVLYGYTTEQLTAAGRPDQEILEQYEHISDFAALLQQLQDRAGLLVRTGTPETPFSRLTHDTFAPLIRERYQDSDAPAQRARRIVETKEREIDRGFHPRFSETDIDTILKAQTMTQRIPERVLQQMKSDRRRYQRQKKERYDLALERAQALIDQLSPKEALESLLVASYEGIRSDELRRYALELPFVLVELDWPEILIDCSRFIRGLSTSNDPPWPEKLARPADRTAWMAAFQAWDQMLFNKLQQRHFPEMVAVSGGTYRMGSEEGFPDEQPVHEVQVDDFLLGATPVTWWQYALFCRSTGRRLPNDSGFGQGDRPVINVNWMDAVAYCNWLSEQEGLPAVYTIETDSAAADWTADGYRLPTEAEWEYAAREGGRSIRFGNGKEVADPAEMNFDAGHVYNEQRPDWYVKGEGRGQTTPVRLFAPNALGLYDMSGNVLEWCWDQWSEGKNGYYAQCAEKGAIVVNPRGPEQGDYRVVRGGSWNFNAYVCRSCYRNRNYPISQLHNIGFRVSRRL